MPSKSGGALRLTFVMHGGGTITYLVSMLSKSGGALRREPVSL